MGMTIHIPLSRRQARRRSRPASVTAIETPAPSPRDLREQRVRASGGPQDQAHYGCNCGYSFTASVGTGVACPHCGASQAW
ncbi:MAG: hypothetical protein NVSMB51_14010 [Solirubrobacteraceae bacterium]